MYGLRKELRLFYNFSKIFIIFLKIAIINEVNEVSNKK